MLKSGARSSELKGLWGRQPGEGTDTALREVPCEAGVGTDPSEVKKGAPPTAWGAREGFQKTVTASGEKATLGNGTVLQGPRAKQVLSEIPLGGES